MILWLKKRTPQNYTQLLVLPQPSVTSVIVSRTTGTTFAGVLVILESSLILYSYPNMGYSAKQILFMNNSAMWLLLILSAQRTCRIALMPAVASERLGNNNVINSQTCPNFNSVSPVTSPNGPRQCIHFSASVTSSLKLEWQWLASYNCSDHRRCRTSTGCYYRSASQCFYSFLQLFIKEMVNVSGSQIQKGMVERRNGEEQGDSSRSNMQFLCLIMIFLCINLAP